MCFLMLLSFEKHFKCYGLHVEATKHIALPYGGINIWKPITYVVTAVAYGISIPVMHRQQVLSWGPLHVSGEQNGILQMKHGGF